MQPAGLGDRADADVADRHAISADKGGREVDEVPVDEAGRDEGARECRAALDEEVADAPAEEAGEHRVEVARAGLDHAQRMPVEGGVCSDGALADDDGHGLVGEELPAVPAGGERGVVGEDGAGADRDRVARRSLLVDPLPCRRAGDPPAGTVRGRRAPVEGRRPFERDEGAGQPYRREPVAQEAFALLGEQSRHHLDARRSEALGATVREFAGVGDGIDHAGDPCGEERFAARTGAPGVVARLEGDDDGGPGTGARGEPRQRVDLGVGRAGAAVPALGDDLSRGGEDDAADTGVVSGRGSPRGQREGAPHGALQRGAPGVDHPVPDISSGRDGLRAVFIGRRCSRDCSARASSHPD